MPTISMSTITQKWNSREDSLMENFLSMITSKSLCPTINSNQISMISLMLMKSLETKLSLSQKHRRLRQCVLLTVIHWRHRFKLIILSCRIQQLLKIQMEKTAFRQVIIKRYLTLSLSSRLKIKVQMMQLRKFRRFLSLKRKSRINWLLSITTEK